MYAEGGVLEGGRRRERTGCDDSSRFSLDRQRRRRRRVAKREVRVDVEGVG